jgi:hypothetical protein
MKNKKPVYFTLAILLLSGSQAWGMLTNNHKKSFARPDIVFCFQNPQDTGSYLPTSYLQQKLAEKYDGESTKRVLQRNPFKIIREHLQAWEELRKNTDRLISRTSQKTILVKPIDLPFIDWTNELYQLLVRAVGINSGYVEKIGMSLARYGQLPDFKEAFYRSCSVIGPETDTYDGCDWSGLGSPILWVLDVKSQAILTTVPFCACSESDTPNKYLKEIAKKRESVELCFAKNPSLFSHVSITLCGRNPKLYGRLSPDTILSGTGCYNPHESFSDKLYNEIVVLGDAVCPRAVKLVALAVREDWLPVTLTFEQKRLWKKLYDVLQRYKIPLILLNARRTKRVYEF